MSITDIAILAAAAVALAAGVWWLRGAYDLHKGTELELMMDAAMVLLKEIDHLQQPDPATIAAQNIEKATVAEKSAALKAAVAKLSGNVPA